MRPLCQNHGCKNFRKYNGYKKDGSRKYHRLCSPCCKKKYNDKYSSSENFKRSGFCKEKPWRTPYGGYTKSKTCCFCGFEAIHRCQLDVDHIDGNNKNNSPSNLQTLCANCHRLKTLLNKDWQQ